MGRSFVCPLCKGPMVHFYRLVRLKSKRSTYFRTVNLYQCERCLTYFKMQTEEVKPVELINPTPPKPKTLLLDEQFGQTADE